MNGGAKGREAIGDRLARLRRQGTGKPDKDLPPPVKSLPTWAKSRLKSKAATSAHTQAHQCSVPKTGGMPQGLASAPDESFHFRVTRLPLGHPHGATALNPKDLAPQGEGHGILQWLTGDAALYDLPLADTVFLDTETTGLSGGAGVFVYMVGLARFVPGGIEVWQGFMAGPEQEAALLDAVRQRIEASAGVVSFFGKSFDRHRLEDKMRLHGIAPPFDGLPHLDLYHPLRRLFGKGFGDGRLQTMERELCGLVRPDDLPGSFAPEAWFDFLAGRAHRLEGVFQHNLDDVLSLISLAQWLSGLLGRPPESSEPLVASREEALAQNLSKVGQSELALGRLTGLMQGAKSAPVSLWLVRAECEYRLQRFDAAIHSLSQVLLKMDGGPEGVRALCLRSKILEHQIRDGAQSLRDTEQGLAWLQELRRFRGRSGLENELTKRADRLRGKR